MVVFQLKKTPPQNVPITAKYTTVKIKHYKQYWQPQEIHENIIIRNIKGNELYSAKRFIPS